jgi:hypothetical protein
MVKIIELFFVPDDGSGNHSFDQPRVIGLAVLLVIIMAYYLLLEKRSHGKKDSMGNRVRELGGGRERTSLPLAQEARETDTAPERKREVVS